jgi:hypothetical protein
MDLSILKPVLVQVSLTFFILIWTAKERLQAVAAGTVKRLEGGQRPVWPDRAAILSNAYENQLEVPQLFYIVVLFALVTGAVDPVMVALAWAYVAFRIIHALIHTTYNKVPHRFVAFMFSNAVLIAMWVKFGLHVLNAA